MTSSPGRTPRRRIREVSLYADDGVSEMSSLAESNTTSIFRRKPPPSFEDDESVLLHKAVSRVLDDALDSNMGTFDAEIMTLDDVQIRESTHLSSAGSVDQCGFGFDKLQSVYDVGSSPLSLHPSWQGVTSSDQALLIIHGGDHLSSRSPAVENKRGKFKRCMWPAVILSIAACTVGGIAALVSSFVQASGTSSTTSAEQLHSPAKNTTRSPSMPPMSFTVPSLNPTLKPIVSPSFGPTFGPTFVPWEVSTLKPSSTYPVSVKPHETSRPTTSTQEPTPTFGPTSAPTEKQSFRELVLEISAGTKAALNNAESAQSLALKRIEETSTNFDKFALLTLAYALNITAWTMSTSTPCTWLGVTCDARETVIKVELRHQDLFGSLPSELALATNLEVIAIAGSSGIDIKGKISAGIPALWGELMTSLRVLELYDNSLSGEIPDSLWRLSTLEHLALDGNRLTGIIPSTLGLMTTLRSFDCSDNYLVGSLPEDLSRLSNLYLLSVKNNRMYGSLPSELGSLTKLQELHLERNSFSYRLPDTLQFLTSLTWLSLQGNQLTGTLPSLLDNLSSLEGLELSKNKLTGSLPKSFANLSNLRILDLSSNSFTGEIPVEWAGMGKLAALLLESNKLHGTVSSPMCLSAMHIRSDCNSIMRCSCCTECFV